MTRIIDSALQIRWNLIKESDLDSFHDMLVEIHDRTYSYENMIEILKLTPRYLVIEAINWGFDTASRDSLYECLKAPQYQGLIEDPDWIKNTTPQVA